MHIHLSGANSFRDKEMSLHIVSVHRAPHLLCCRAHEVQKYGCAPEALHLRHPVNLYN